MTRYALWQQLASYPAQIDRLFPQEIWPTPGRLRGMAVTVATGRVVNIAAGSLVVALGGGQGSALCVSDAVEPATFAAAPGAGSTRIDLIVVQVHDAAIDAGSSNGFTFDVVPGVPAASPVPPAVPARAASLAQVWSIGGQANLAQANIAQPPTVTGLAAPVGADLSSNLYLPTPNSPVAIMQTPTLAPGLWSIHAQALIGNNPGSTPGGASLYGQITGGSGAIFPGLVAYAVLTPNGPAGESLSVDATVRVDTALSVTFNGVSDGANGAIVYALGMFNLPATGWAARYLGPVAT